MSSHSFISDWKNSWTDTVSRRQRRQRPCCFRPFQLVWVVRRLRTVAVCVQVSISIALRYLTDWLQLHHGHCHLKPAGRHHDPSSGRHGLVEDWDSGTETRLPPALKHSTQTSARRERRVNCPTWTLREHWPMFESSLRDCPLLRPEPEMLPQSITWSLLRYDGYIMVVWDGGLPPREKAIWELLWFRPPPVKRRCILRSNVTCYSYCWLLRQLLKRSTAVNQPTTVTH